MGEWRALTLGELGVIVTGQTPSKSHPEDWGEYLPFLTPSDQREGWRTPQTRRKLSKVGAERFASRIVPEGATAVTCIASVGKISQIETPTLTNQQINSVIPDLQIITEDFLYYSLCLQGDRLRAMASGSATPIVSKSLFSSLELKIPSLDVQQKIGRLLRSLDDKIAANEKISNLARRLALGLVCEAAGEQRVALAELVEHRREQVEPARLPDNVVQYYSLPGFDAGERVLEERPEEIKSSKFLVSSEAVLFSKLNPATPRVWLAEPRKGGVSLASTEFLVLVPRHISSHLLWAICAQPGVSEGLVGLARGTSKSHQRVSPADILSRDVPDPIGFSIETIIEIEGLIRLAASTQEESRNLSAMRDVLLPELLSGSLNFPAVDDLVSNAV